MNAYVAVVIESLQSGEDVSSYREGGNSMTPIIKSRTPVTLRPILDHKSLRRGDIVLTTVGGSTFTHLISAVAKGRVQISNNHGRVNVWTPYAKVYGIVTAIDGMTRRNSQYR